MARIKLNIPKNFVFSTLIPIRITDINYGNDSVLSLLHEARMQYLKSIGYTELSLGGVALIMSDVAIEFKAEAYYGEVLKAYVTPADLSRVSFDIYYKLLKSEGEEVVALAKTGMVCYDYGKKKVAAIPDEVRMKMQNS